MFQSSVFFAWMNLLQDLGYDIKQFVEQELEEQFLVQKGWTRRISQLCLTMSLSL